MAFDAIFAEAARPLLLEGNGQSVIYHAPEVDALTLTAAVGPITTSEQDEREGRQRKQTRIVLISTDPTSAEKGVATPLERDVVEISGERWKVESIESLTGSMARLQVVRIGSIEVSRPSYRGR